MKIRFLDDWFACEGNGECPGFIIKKDKVYDLPIEVVQEKPDTSDNRPTESVNRLWKTVL